MGNLDFLAALHQKQLYEQRPDSNAFYTVLDYPEFGTHPTLRFVGFQNQEEISERVSYDFAAQLQAHLNELVKTAMRYAAQEKLICNYTSRRRLMDGTHSQMPGMTYLRVLADELPSLSMEPEFTFQAVLIFKDKPGFYLEFDAGDAPDSDPENFEYLELYQYIGFHDDLKLMHDDFTDTIWR